MSVTTSVAKIPATPAAAVTLHQAFMDPSLSRDARALLAMLSGPIAIYGRASFFLAEIAESLDCHVQTASLYVAELKRAGLIVYKMGGRGRPNTFTFGPRLSITQTVIWCSTRTRRLRKSTCSPAIPFKFTSGSHAKAEPPTPPVTALVRAYNYDDVALSREASSSPLEKKLLAFDGMTQLTAKRLVRQYPPEQIEMQIRAIPHHPVKHSPAGFLVRAIEGNYALPASLAGQIRRATQAIAPPIDRESQNRRIAEDLRDDATWLRAQGPFFRRMMRAKSEIESEKFLGDRDHPDFERHVQDALFQRIRSYRQGRSAVAS